MAANQDNLSMKPSAVSMRKLRAWYRARGRNGEGELKQCDPKPTPPHVREAYKADPKLYFKLYNALRT